MIFFCDVQQNPYRPIPQFITKFIIKHPNLLPISKIIPVLLNALELGGKPSPFIQIFQQLKEIEFFDGGVSKDTWSILPKLLIAHTVLI